MIKLCWIIVKVHIYIWGPFAEIKQASMKPVKLKRHLITKHVKARNTSTRKHRWWTRPQFQKNQDSYWGAQRITKNKKPYTIAQELTLEMCEIILGTEAANKLKSIPLSNDTMRRRTEELSADVQSQLLDRLSSWKQFSLQLDESDIASEAQFVVVVRYPWFKRTFGSFEHNSHCRSFCDMFSWRKQSYGEG